LSGVHDHNRRAWDALVRQNQRHTRPATDADLAEPLRRLDQGWLDGDLRGKQVLCLAAGGGWQSALYAAAGAQVTVVDLSPAMLALDREVAASRQLPIRTVETSMDDLSMFPAGSFEIVTQPVSSCYIPDIRPLYKEVARVLAPGGLYLSQHKQPASLQAEARPTENGYLLAERYYRTGPLPTVEGSRHREPGTLEFLHRWEELLGELCHSGFVIEDVCEPYHGSEGPVSRDSFAHRSRYLPPYVRIKARRVGPVAAAPRIWLPS